MCRARTGDPVPDQPGSLYTSLTPIRWTDEGGLLFRAIANDGDVYTFAIDRWTQADGLTMLVSGGPVGYGAIETVDASRAGEIAFEDVHGDPDGCSAYGSFPTKALWKRDALGIVTPLWIPGDAIPGAAPGTIGLSNELVASDAGRVVIGFVRHDTSPCNPFRSPPAPDGFAAQDDDGALVLVVEIGQPAPGVPEATIHSLDVVDHRSLDASGRLAFEAELEDGSGQRASAIYRWAPSTGVELIDLGPWRVVHTDPWLDDPAGSRTAPILDADGRAHYFVTEGHAAMVASYALYTNDGSGPPVRRIGPGDPLPGADHATIVSVYGLDQLFDPALHQFRNSERAAIDRNGDRAVLADVNTGILEYELAIVEITADGAVATRVRQSDFVEPQAAGLLRPRITVIGYREDGAMVVQVHYDISYSWKIDDFYLLERGAPPVHLAPLLGDGLLDASLSRSASLAVETSPTFVESLFVEDVPEPAAAPASLAALVALAIGARVRSRRAAA
jgi:hypothetical protein